MKRLVLFAFAAVIIAMAALPIGTAVGQALSGHGTAHVLASESEVDYGIGLINGSAHAALPLATVSGISTVTNSYTYKINATLTGTAYYASDMLFTNMTLAEMNLHSVNALDMAISAHGNVSLVLGTGSLGNNLTYSFSPLLQTSFYANGTHNVNFSISPALLTANQSNDIEMQLSFKNATANPTFTVGITPIGTASAEPWYLAGESTALIAGGILLFGAGFMALPFIDVNISQMGPMQYVSGRKRKNPSNAMYKLSGKPGPKPPMKKTGSKTGKKGGK